MTDADFDDYTGQLQFAINDVETLGRAIPLSDKILNQVARIDGVIYPDADTEMYADDNFSFEKL